MAAPGRGFDATFKEVFGALGGTSAGGGAGLAPGAAAPGAAAKGMTMMAFKDDSARMAVMTARELNSSDVVFVIDCTGSMGSYIAAANDQVTLVMDGIKKQFPDAIVRFAVVGYRDHDCKDPRDVLAVQDFTPDVDLIKKFLSTLKAKEGGDEPENVLGALDCANRLSWKYPTRVMIHIADAPSHGRDLNDVSGDKYKDMGSEPHGLLPDDVLKGMCILRINYVFLAVNSSTDKMTNYFGAVYEKAFPVMKLPNGGETRAVIFKREQLGVAYEKLAGLIIKGVTESVLRTLSTSGGKRAPWMMAT